MVANYGFNDYGTKKIAEVRDDVKKKSIVFFNIMLTKGLLSFMCIAIYIPFCFLYSNDETSLFMMLIMLGNIIAILIDPVFLFQGEENFISIAIRNSIIKILTVICFFIFVKSNQDILIYTFIMSISYVLSSSIIYFSFRKNSFVKINKIDLHPVFYLKEAFPYFIPALATSLYTNLNSVLLGAIGNDNTQNGYYSQAMKFINLLTALINSLSIVLLARVSYLTKRGDEEQIKQKTKLSFECFFALALKTIPFAIAFLAVYKFSLSFDAVCAAYGIQYIRCRLCHFGAVFQLDSVDVPFLDSGYLHAQFFRREEAGNDGSLVDPAFVRRADCLGKIHCLLFADVCQSFAHFCLFAYGIRSGLAAG